MNLKKQKYLVTALILMILPFGIAWIPYFSSKSITKFALFFLILFPVVFSVISLVKKEGYGGIFVIAFEMLVAYWWLIDWN